MAHSWLYKLKGISRKHLPSSPKHLSSSSSTDASSSRKLRDILRLSSSAHHPHGSSSPPKSSWNHSSKSSYANGISDSTAGIPTNPVSSSFSDQNYGFSGDPESQSVDIKDDHSVRNLGDVSEDSENSSPILVETVKQPPFDMRTHQKLKKPKASSSGIRIRANSPKITGKKTKGRTSPESKKKGIAESFAIVLTSVDPEKDFRESMVEMIVENKMKEQKDLEDLLACYLSMNSSEYHDIIIKAFKKTWFHLIHLT